MKKMKLSDKQKSIIRLMREGKELYWSGGFEPTAGFSGGASLEVSSATFFALKRLGIIGNERKAERSLMTYYTLTELGKQIPL